MAFEVAASAFDGLDALDIGDLLCEDDGVLCMGPQEAFCKNAATGFPFCSHLGSQSPNSTHHDDNHSCDAYDKRETQRNSSSSSGLSICPDLEANNKQDMLTGSGLLEPSCSDLRKIGSHHNNIDGCADMLATPHHPLPSSPAPAAAGMPQSSQHSRGAFGVPGAAHVSRRSSFAQPLATGSGSGGDGSDDEGGSAGAGKPQSHHSSVEKQRRDRLNQLMDALADAVPPSDLKYQVAEGSGNRRPKHVVLSDAIALLRHLQAATPAPAPSGVKRVAGALAPLPLPMPINLPQRALAGVVLEIGGASPLVWHITVTCSDRQGLLADVAAVLRALPLRITTASATTSPQGKASCAFEVVVEDGDLSPEEVQCAVNAALYAHLLPASHQAAAPAPPAAKRTRLE